MQIDYKKSVERYNDFLKLRSEGKSFAYIGAKYGITWQAVQFRIKKGVPIKSSGNKINGNSLLLKKITGKDLRGRERTRMLVRIRDNFTCQDCGLVRTPKMAEELNKRLFDIHHFNECGKKSRSYDKVDDLGGMITLCHKCHFNRPEHTTKYKVLTKTLSTSGI